MQVVQAFAAEDKEFEKFKAINKEHRNANIKAIFAYSVFFPVVEIVSALAIGLIVWYGSGQKADVGTIMSFILCLNLLFRPLRVIADKFNVLQMGMIAGERVFKVMDNNDVTPETFQGGTGGDMSKSTITRAGVVFQHVWFAYTGQQYVLKDISFNI